MEEEGPQTVTSELSRASWRQAVELHNRLRGQKDSMTGEEEEDEEEEEEGEVDEDDDHDDEDDVESSDGKCGQVSACVFFVCRTLVELFPHSLFSIVSVCSLFLPIFCDVV